MSYIDNLINNCQKAKLATPVETREFYEGEGLDCLQGIKTGIYIIEIFEGDIEAEFNNYVAFKGKKERACAKINKPSSILYVGSSTTGVKKRLDQHLGNGNEQTYALHLKYWFKGKYKVTVKQYDVSKDVLQIIEDDISSVLQPAFGKLGGNNK